MLLFTQIWQVEIVITLLYFIWKGKLQCKVWIKKSQGPLFFHLFNSVCVRDIFWVDLLWDVWSRQLRLGLEYQQRALKFKAKNNLECEKVDFSFALSKPFLSTLFFSFCYPKSLCVQFKLGQIWHLCWNLVKSGLSICFNYELNCFKSSIMSINVEYRAFWGATFRCFSQVEIDK